MTPRNLFSLPSLVGAYVLAVSVISADTVEAGALPTSKTVQTQTKDSVTLSDDVHPAKYWGLTEKEWRRYKEIMQGPRGWWSPNLDPIEVLGLYADSDAERLRYAEMQARLNAERVERELAWVKASMVAAKRVQGTNVSYFDFGKSTLAAKRERRGYEPGDRLMFFTRVTCARCGKELHRLIEKSESMTGVGVDVFVVGKVSDDVVRGWARKLKVSPARVEKREITLNHDNGTLSRLGISRDRIDNRGGLLFRKRNGGITAVPKSDFGL
jgi:integrating conjugative element protein (TIGR03759 family)